MLLIQTFFEKLANFLESIVFFDILFFSADYKMPIAIFFLLVGVIYFSFKLNFINFRMVHKSVKIFFEKEKEIDGNKAVTSKAAFLSAISGCVGVGNISGVAAAIFTGGPGAVLWMFIIGFLIMPLRYAEVFLGHFFREKSKDGTIVKYGPYAYIGNGLIKAGYSKGLSKFLFVFYAISILVGSVGALIMQVNPLAEITGYLVFGGNASLIFVFSIVLACILVFVISGGLKRIIHSMEGAVSIMSLIYIISIGIILALNIQNIPAALSLIFTEAFKLKSVYGGLLGVLIVSFTRTIIATEVGLGTVSLLHGKSQNDNSVREGLLSMAGPFFANCIFITLNSVAVLASGVHKMNLNGILMINEMFSSVHAFFPFVLLVITFLFAFTTAIAWYFYAEASIKQITDRKLPVFLYQLLFFILICVSGLVSFGVMLRIIDAVVLAIVFPNVIALILLGRVVKKELYKADKY